MILQLNIFWMKIDNLQWEIPQDEEHRELSTIIRKFQLIQRKKVILINHMRKLKIDYLNIMGLCIELIKF